MWKVKSKHELQKVYVRERSGLEIMISGEMIFYLDKETVTLEFAAQLDLVDHNGLKAKSFTTYVV
jgi:hypothetical protein